MSSKKTLFQQCDLHGFLDSRFRSLSRGFMRFHFSTIHRLGPLFIPNLRFCNHFRGARLNSLARRGGCHWSFQFSPRIFESFRMFFVVWINKINSCQSSSIVELRFFPCPFLFLSILNDFSNFRPIFWRKLIWSGSRPSLRQSPPGPHVHHWRLLFLWSKFRQVSVRIDIAEIVNAFSCMTS